jgi:hypothetical protein
MKKARIHDATIARNPSTTITAIAQCGNPAPEDADCTWPCEEDAGVFVDVREAEDADAAEAEDADDAEDAEAAEAEEAAMTESANVVSVMRSRSIQGVKEEEDSTNGRPKM